MTPWIKDKWQWLQRMNWITTLVLFALIVIGVLFVYSASYAREEASVRFLFRKQIYWAVAGFLCYFAMTTVDYRKWRDGAWWFYALAVILLVAVLIVGTRIYGARRWLMFFDIGVQPSELAKVAVILCLADLMGEGGRQPGTMRFLGGVAVLVGVPVLLILKEPDLGTALVFGPTVLAMLYVGGVPGRLLLTGIGIAAVAVGLVISAVVIPDRLGWSAEQKDALMRWTHLSGYQQERIEVFLNPGKDPLGAGWNKTQSEIAVGSGGMTGKGYLKGTQNMLGFLPKTVAPTDFIFSVITEEMGFVGSLTVLGLFAVLLIGGMQAAVLAPDQSGRLICVGVMAMLFSHIAVNVSMTVGLMPITGLPLPLISYGGTFMLSIMAALGLVQSVYVRRTNE